MSDYRDIVKEALEKGILLDECGLVERYYDSGSYRDLCGMDPQEILENMRKAGQGGGGGEEPSKTTVKLTASVVSGETGWVINVKSNTILPDTVVVTVTADGTPNTITIPAGSLEATSEWTVDKYAAVSATVSPSSTEENVYKITITNPNGDGMKTVSIDTYKDGGESGTKTETHKVGDNVTINVPQVEGCDFNHWEVNGETGDTETVEFVMPDSDDVEVKFYYDVQTFVIIFKNWNGDILQSGETKYNVMPIYDSETPTKDADVQYTYTFSGWDSAIVPAKENKNYTAQFNETVNKYEIKFFNYNGELLQRKEVEFGVTPTYDGATPTKAATPQYTYTFNGWDPAIVPVVGDADYNAQFSETINSYLITFKNWNDTVLQSSNVNYGETPVYEGKTPEKIKEGYTCVFDGWDPDITAVTEAAIYTAQFTETVNEYPLVLDNFNTEIMDVTVNGEPYSTGSTYEYGSQIVIEAEIKEAYKPEYHFDNSGDTWSTTITVGVDNEVVIPVVGYDEYTITWVISGETETETYEYGATPTHTDPASSHTQEYDYIFSAWTPEIEAVTGNATYTAVFEAIKNSYKVVLHGINAEVSGSGVYEYGTEISISAEPESGYTFDQWSDGNTDNPRTITVTDNITLSAETSIMRFTVVLYDDDHCDVTGDGEYDWGEEVTITATPNEHYKFDQWSDGNTESARTFEIYEDIELTASTIPLYMITYQLSGYTDMYKEYAEGDTIVNYTAEDYGLSGVTIDWKDASGQTYNVMPAKNFTYIGEIVSAEEKAYWGRVNTSDFDALGKTFSVGDLTAILSQEEGGYEGSDVAYGDRSIIKVIDDPTTTSITYEYTITEDDYEATDEYEEEYDEEKYYNYIIGHSMYYIYVIPSRYLIDNGQTVGEIVLHGNNGDGTMTFITESGYTIDGVEYSVIKCTAREAEHKIGAYTVPLEYFSVLDAPSYDTGDLYPRPTTFTLYEKE